MTTLEPNTAYDYALLIKEELLALETLLENWGAIAGEAPADVDPDIRADVLAALRELGREWPENDGEDVFSDYLNELCLDLIVLRAVNNDNDATRVEILRTSGGPRCDITRDSNDGEALEISVHDGGGHSVVRVYLSNIAAGLDDLAGNY